jgi:5-methylcytosine-specific restriction endonuclease McrA
MQIMKNNKNNAPLIANTLLVWKQIEDTLVPRLRLNLVERVVYYHLLRHSRLEGKLQLRFSILWLTRGIRLSAAPARGAVRTLVEKGVLRLVERTRAGHVVDVLLPDEIHAAAPDGPVPSCLARRPRAASIEESDFLLTKTRRAAIHARDRGLCFYCLTQLTPRTRCLDHVIPLARRGKNSYRNLVSCCTECNTQKGETAAEDFLRTLCRQRRVTAAELADRLRALDALAAGNLRPTLPTPLAQFGGGTPKPTPASYKRFPVWSQSYDRKPRRWCEH